MKKANLIGNIIAEFAPVTTFVVVSEAFGFFTALKALIIVATLALLLSWFIEKRIPKFGLIASGTILLFGSISIFRHDPFYIIIKDTLYSGTFGIILLLGLLSGKNYFKILFGDFFALTERGWNTLVIRWIIFFFLLVLGNEIARHELHRESWVVYKLCSLIATWIFGFYQLTLTRRERLPEANAFGLRVREG